MAIMMYLKPFTEQTPTVAKSVPCGIYPYSIGDVMTNKLISITTTLPK